MRSLVLICGFALLAGCASMNAQSESRALELTLTAYANAIRWGDISQAIPFVDPETLKKHPLSDLDIARYKQVHFASYNEQPAVPVGAHQVRQVVKISLVNVNTQVERSIVDNQLWRYDEATKHWLLVSGLPDITQRPTP
ncbi:MAG: hypothetical protein JSR27_09265 [Proteobacteria bacterium]|nr:hypothetical protein [Pseudomonadota bacterium]